MLASAQTAGRAYERRRPEKTALYAVVREHIATLYAAVETGFDGAALPPFVRRELDGYLECGLLCRGFAVFQCDDCKTRHLVAYSCKGRGFCPGCLGRRMAQGTLNLVERVLPLEVPLRQWVLTLPFELRARLGYDGALMSEATRLFTDSVLGWYRRHLSEHGVRDGSSGAFVVIQRTSADLRLNPHVHAVILDGVYAPAAPGGALRFHPLPRLSTSDVADVLQVARVRIVRMLQRRGVVPADPEATCLDDALGEQQPALAKLAAAAVSGSEPAGPAIRRGRVDIPLRRHPGAVVTAPLCVTDQGFSLHAATHVNGWDTRGREALVKYVLRPPLAQERVVKGPDGLVRIALKREFSDGTYAIDLDPLSLLCRLAAAIPPPRYHLVRYAGVLASASAWRSLVVPPPPPPDASASPPPLENAAAGGAGTPGAAATPDRATRTPWRRWSELLLKTLGIDRGERCPLCSGPMRLLALVNAPDEVVRYLRHLGEPTEPPPRAPARDPPYFTTPPRRRRREELDVRFEA